MRYQILQSLNMNSNFMLQNFIENGSSATTDQRQKKSSKMGIQQIQMQVGTVYNEICQLLEQQGVEIALPKEVSKANDKLNILKQIVASLLEKTTHNQRVNDSNAITCPDCQNYQTNLQKLENQVRQHIRVCQQLKLYQDTQEEKLEQCKKEKKQNQRKIQYLKKQIEEVKSTFSAANQKMLKLEGENEQLKKELKQTRRNASTQQEILTTKRETHKQSTYGYDSKENKIDWAHRNISIKKEEKDKQNERRSIEKKNESAQKNWRVSANTKSTKLISVMNDKLVQEKTREERRKVIQSKFDYRR